MGGAHSSATALSRRTSCTTLNVSMLDLVCLSLSLTLFLVQVARPTSSSSRPRSVVGIWTSSLRATPKSGSLARTPPRSGAITRPSLGRRPFTSRHVTSRYVTSLADAVKPSISKSEEIGHAAIDLNMRELPAAHMPSTITIDQVLAELKTTLESPGPNTRKSDSS